MKPAQQKTVFRLMATLLAVAALSCDPPKSDAPVPADQGSMTLAFTNVVGSNKLNLGTTTYTNATGEPYTVTTFNYFVSNVGLTTTDGSTITVPNSYFLIRAADPGSLSVTLPNLPAGAYKALTFTIGVDSLKSTSPVTGRTGVLDPASYGTDNMYWSWNSGYVFMKFEGVSPAAPVRADGSRAVQLHVGGFGGGVNGAARTLNNLRTAILFLPTPAIVGSGSLPVVQVQTDMSKLIDNRTKISFATLSDVHSPALAGSIADNYAGMFSVSNVANGQK